jgi:hypothetical protein
MAAASVHAAGPTLHTLRAEAPSSFMCFLLQRWACLAEEDNLSIIEIDIEFLLHAHQ